MALIKCTECGQMISDKAARCPKCGCPIVRRPVPPVQQPQARPQRPQQPQAAQQQPAPQAERPQSKPQQPVAPPLPQKQGRGKNIAIVLLSAALIVLIVVFLVLLLKGKDTPAETMRISSPDVTTMSIPSAPSASSSSSSTSQSSSSSSSGGYTSEILGSRRYEGDIEGIKCYFSLYFEAKDDGGEQDVSGSYYYKKSGSDHPLGLRGTYYEETGVLFLREYLEDGSPHASMEVNYNKYSGNFYGTFTRYTGERMSISMRGI